MEQRKLLYEKLKNFKVTKLKLKQANNEDITINLKDDLLNENVQISDKVIDMLEALANKYIQQQHQKQQTTASNTTDSLNTISDTPPPPPPPPLPLTPATVQPAHHVISPSHETTVKQAEKRKSDENNESNLEPPNKKPQPQPSQIIIASTTTTTTKIPAAETNNDQQPNETNKNENLCRICLLKCSSEKALHDHVTRIHGSSDIRRKAHYKSGNKLTTQQPSSHVAKPLSSKPQVTSMFAKPNVAIRVAKVAYYDSKFKTTGSSSGTNVFKSNLFINGIRGNFFSQERLPLKSCKIKIKKNKNNQSLSLATNDDNNPVIEKSKINEFFRSLLAYIPVNVNHLDDLILPNQLTTDETKLIRQIHSSVLESREIGISLYSLKSDLNIESMNLLIKMINILLNSYLIIAVGVVERVYVAHEFCEPWIILSYKNQKGRNYGSQSGGSGGGSGDTNEDQQEKSNVDKQYKKVHLVPRPWRYIDGLLNRPVLQKMLESIVLYLKSNPQATFERISQHYCPVLQPIMTLELLDMLIHLKCVHVTFLNRQDKCTLESEFEHNSQYIFDYDRLNGNEICTYECTLNSIFILKQVFS